MRIHTNVLTDQHFVDAAKRAGVTLVACDRKGSKSRTHAFEFALSGHGVYGGQWGSQGYKTATWDEWGMVLADLFTADPMAHTGANGYQCADHFHWCTDARFTALTPAFQHLRHRWSDYPFTGAQVHAQGYQECWCDCGAAQRWLMPGIAFGQLVAMA